MGRLRSGAAWVVGLGWLAAMPVLADTRYAFDLARQPLPQALSVLSRLTGQSIVYVGDQPYGVQASPLRGELTVEEALQRLLGPTALTWRRLGPHTLTVEPRPALPSSALVLDATAVVGQAPGVAAYLPPASASVALTDTPTRDQPQAINTVSAQVLQDRAPRHLDEALINVSGITQGNTLGSTQDTLMKRGFGENRDGAIMRDGMPVVQGRNLNATAERIEVLKGPASLLYGIQDPGGIINVVSKQPQATPYHALTARGSTYARGRQGSGGGLDSTGPVGEGGLAYRLIVDHQNEEYWRNFGTDRETLVAPSLAWDNDDTHVLLAYERRRFRYPLDRGTAIDPATNRPLAIPAQRRLDEPFNDMQGQSSLYRAQFHQRLGAHWQLQAHFSYNRETYDASQIRITGINPGGTLTRSMDGTRDARASERFASVRLAGEQQGFGLRHALLIGVDDDKRDLYRGELIRQPSRSVFSYLDPVYGREVEGSRVSAADSHQRDTLRSHSLFAQDAVHLSERWIALFGARLQRYDQLAGKGRPFQVNTDTHGQAWVPRAGLVFQPDQAWALYGSYSEGFKPNSSVAALAGNTVIDAAIEPERSRAWELGVKFNVAQRLDANLALYSIRKRNVLVANYDPRSTATVYSNAGQVRSRGLELDVTAQLEERWSLIGNYAFTDAWVARDPTYQGNRLQNVARHSGGLFAVYDWGQVLGGDRLRLGSGAHYVGERAGNPQNDFHLPGYTVADAFASYDTTLAGQAIRLDVHLKNLFDRVYYTSAVNRYFVSVGDARQLQVALTAEF